MKGQISRKEFFTAAAAAGAAAIIPAKAFADEGALPDVAAVESDDVLKVEKDSKVVEGTSWQSAANPSNVDIQKSKNGILFTNEEGFFGFAKWIADPGILGDSGFAFKDGTFLVKGKTSLWGLELNGKTVSEWITSLSTISGWECEVWASGRKVARKRVDYQNLSMTRPYGNGFYQDVETSLPSGFFSSIENVQGQIWSGYGITWWSLASVNVNRLSGYAASMSSLTSNVSIFYEVHGR